MTKEPIKREVEQPATEGWKHGYTEAQIKIIEDARGEPQKAPEAKSKTPADTDHDEQKRKER